MQLVYLLLAEEEKMLELKYKFNGQQTVTQKGVIYI